MPKEVKGITIEIGANAQGFQKELAKINKESKKTSNQLRDINKLLKLDPKNTELLDQKQRALKTSIEQTNKRLELTRSELSKLKEAHPDEVTDKMDALQRQIAEDESKVKSLNKQLKEFGSIGKQQAMAVAKEMQETGKKVSEVGGKIKEVGDGLTTHVTAPIVALGGATIASFNEVDSAYDTIIQKTGATGEVAQEMYDIVDNLATSIPTDFQTAGDAVGEVNTRFGVTGEELESLSEQYIKFADLNGLEVTPAIDATQKALEAFGLGAEDAEGYLDALNKASQDSGISIDTLTGLTVNNATALQEMGLSLEDSTALMAQVEKSGVPVETVMNGLSKALKKATDEGVPFDEALSNLQKTILENEDGTEGLSEAYDLFGKSGDKVFKAIQDGTLDFESLGETATDSVGSVSDTFNETLDPIDQWKLTMNELKLTGAELGATLGEIVAPMLQQLADIVSSLREKWESLSPEQQKMIEQVAMVIAVVGPVVSIIGSIVMFVGNLITAVGTLSAVLGVSVGVIGGVVVAIGAVIAIIVLAIMHWDKIKETVKNVWESISQYMSNLRDSVSQKWEEIKQGIAQRIDSIKADLSSKWNQIKSDTVNKVVGLKNDVVNKYIEIKTSVIDKITNMKDTAVQKFVDMKTSILGKVNELRDKIKEKLDKIKSFFTDLKLKIPKPEMPSLPSFSLETSTRTVFGKEITYPSGISVNWNAKAMEMPYLFTNPTIMQTPYGYVGAGEAGHEIMYGKEALMRDITQANAINNDALINGFYVAMVSALKSADIRVDISGREFGRILREAGAL